MSDKQTIEQRGRALQAAKNAAAKAHLASGAEDDGVTSNITRTIEKKIAPVIAQYPKDDQPTIHEIAREAHEHVTSAPAAAPKLREARHNTNGAFMTSLKGEFGMFGNSNASSYDDDSSSSKGFFGGFGAKEQDSDMGSVDKEFDYQPSVSRPSWMV
eukprot:TRINITY_DN5465_c0_g1_i1.p1 TRINITY_DN5465_c0_g1~~TRINITY_DN5465_c0_g1_i1.p1  ORF type:complete len:157 (+),score=43.54 TRINITY_DN5465_c0_g1_i1:124-594(+)